MKRWNVVMTVMAAAALWCGVAEAKALTRAGENKAEGLRLKAEVANEKGSIETRGLVGETRPVEAMEYQSIVVGDVIVDADLGGWAERLKAERLTIALAEYIAQTDEVPGAPGVRVPKGMMVSIGMPPMFAVAGSPEAWESPSASADAAAAPAAAPPKTSVWALVLAAAIPLAIAGLKLLIPRIPGVWLPIIAPLLGAGAELILTAAGKNPAPGWGPVLGLAGVGIREIADQLKQKTPFGSSSS